MIFSTRFTFLFDSLLCRANHRDYCLESKIPLTSRKARNDNTVTYQALLLWRSCEDTVAVSVYTSYRNWYRKDPKNRDFENSYSATRIIIHVPNRTFLVRFGGISGEFGRAMVRILARSSRAKIPMARPNEPDMTPKRTKKIRLGIYRTQIQPKI